jgi:putative phosphoribosyl transferase
MVTEPRSQAAESRIHVEAGSHRLEGILRVPAQSRGLVLFAHGSGSGRLSPRNQFVAQVLNEGGLATLLFDLLDEEEAEDRRYVFDVDLLARRLTAAASQMMQDPQWRTGRIGYFGSSTGAAAALVAAAGAPERIDAIVSRGGRPDLAESRLAGVRAATLLIVGGNDQPVVRLNEQALAQLRCPKDLVVIPGATHLFPEPGALEEVARLARDWFVQHLAPLEQHEGPNGIEARPIENPR